MDNRAQAAIVIRIDGKYRTECLLAADGKVDINDIYGQKYATLNTPPNDQLRWEKTASWNAGVDFSFWGSRLGGSFDFYRKSGSDLLTVTDLDPTTGWSQLTINNGKMVNTALNFS